MAIVIEQPNSRNKLKLFIIWGTIILTIILIIYYFFFKKPPLIEVFVPPVAKEFKKISAIKLHPSSILENPNFKMLRNYVPKVSVPVLGKDNPFGK